MKKHLFGIISAAVLAFTSVPFIAVTATETQNDKLTGKTPDGSYDYEVWNDGGTGEISFDGAEKDGGVFSCKWDGVRNCIFSKGHAVNQPGTDTY